MSDGQIILGGERVKTDIGVDGVHTLKTINTPASGGGGATTGTTTAISVATTSTPIWAASTARRGGSIRNTSTTATVYVSFGATAPTTSLCTFDLGPGEILEVPSMYWPLSCNAIVATGTVSINVTEAT